MTVNVYHKHSVVKDKAPDVKQVELGEIAINANQDSPALYIKDSADRIVKIGGDIAKIEHDVQGLLDLVEKIEAIKELLDGNPHANALIEKLEQLTGDTEANKKCCLYAQDKLDEHAAHIKQHATELDVHSEHLAEIDKEIEELKRILALLQGGDDHDIEELQKRVEALEVSVEQIGNDVNKIDQEQEQIKADLTALSLRVDELEAKTITAGEGITVTVTDSDTLVEIDQVWLEAYLEAYLKKNIAKSLPPIA